MANKLKKALMFLLCFLFIFAATAVSVPYEEAEARTIFDVENEIKEYKNQLVALQSELANISANIKDLQNQSGQTAALLTQYMAEIEALEADIAINQAIAESYDLQRAQVVTEMAIIQEDYEYRVSMYKKMMQFIYENSEVNSFELLFSSESLSDFLTRREHFNDIMNAANVLIKEIEVSISDLELLKSQLEETQSKYDEYLTGLNRSKLEKEQKIQEFNTIAAELNLNADDLSAQYGNKNQKVAEIKKKIAALEEERREMMSSDAPFGWPVSVVGRVTSQYGWRGDPFGLPSTEYHKGIDIACAKGTPVLAVKDGIVTRASWNGGYGECVIIYHGDGISSLYAHLDNTTSSRKVYEVKVGDSVKKGQVIAYVGTTGRSTGYHLHFGVIDTNTYTSLGGNYVNPNLYLPDGYYVKKSSK
ncbi:MAG: peptidoglycan DD-metalloendopeptidase family protein [Clostridia bacterium]|nr:peptidoglycan DD-metalloendopeptidase family protein [Clostridia bacterium]